MFLSTRKVESHSATVKLSQVTCTHSWLPLACVIEEAAGFTRWRRYVLPQSTFQGTVPVYRKLRTHRPRLSGWVKFTNGLRLQVRSSCMLSGGRMCQELTTEIKFCFLYKSPNPEMLGLVKMGGAYLEKLRGKVKFRHWLPKTSV